MIFFVDFKFLIKSIKYFLYHFLNHLFQLIIFLAIFLIINSHLLDINYFDIIIYYHLKYLNFIIILH